MHAESIVSQVLVMSGEGANASEISRSTGLPRRTVSDWINGKLPARAPRRRPRSPRPVRHVALRGATAAAYCYLLGVYLGDGHLTSRGGSTRLRVTLDLAYPGIIAATAEAIRRVEPLASVRIHPRSDAGCADVSCYSSAWPSLFPQHGPGPKHLRDVSLTAWQRGLTTRDPAAFVRGLIHSDGSRYIARQRQGDAVYEYSRYCFNNRSSDLICEFCAHLDLLGVQWTIPRRDCVQVARREGVESLDRLVGPKR